MWKTRELDVFIHRLILDSRDGARQGFPMTVAHEMLFLAETNRILRAMDAAQQLQIKLSEAYKLVMEGDKASQANGPWDDPSVSRDSASRRFDTKNKVKPAIAPSKEAALTGPWAMLGRFIYSKWFLFAVVAALSVKLTMPLLQATFAFLK